MDQDEHSEKLVKLLTNLKSKTQFKTGVALTQNVFLDRYITPVLSQSQYWDRLFDYGAPVSDAQWVGRYRSGWSSGFGTRSVAFNDIIMNMLKFYRENYIRVKTDSYGTSKGIIVPKLTKIEFEYFIISYYLQDMIKIVNIRENAEKITMNGGV